MPLVAFRGKPLMLPRSQSVNAARELVGWQEILDFIILNDQRVAFSITPEYGRSFRPCNITQYLFCTNNLVFSGSRIANRSQCDVLADYFGLPTDFRSTLCFDPRVSTFLVDFNVYASLSGCLNKEYTKNNRYYCCFDEWDEGLFVRVHAPLVHTKWDLNFCEQITSPGMLDYPAGYMANRLITRNELPQNAKTALSGYITFGDMQSPLKYGRLSCRTQTKTRLSDIEFALGYNFCVNECHHAGVAIRVSVPTGNVPNPKYLFQPVIGNGGHWELGATLTGHYIFWESEDGCQATAVYADANITHLFQRKQLRSFDFKKNGPGSRYVLLEEIGNLVVQEVEVNDRPIRQQYHARLVPAINKTTLEASIDIAVQADLVLKLAYMHENWQVDLGYNFWIRSKERLRCREQFPNNIFAIKGDAQLYGFDVPQIVGINATQSNATLNAGQGNGNTTNNFINANADNPGLATFDGNPLLQTNVASLVNTGVTSLAQINGSSQSIVLNDNDIDPCSALISKTWSNKVFAHINYSWFKDKCVIPFVGIGTEVEFAGRDIQHRGTFSQWGVWVKGGFSY
jgi:hypothetical protein